MPDGFVITLVDQQGVDSDLALTLPDQPTGSDLVEALGHRLPDGSGVALFNERTGSQIAGTDAAIDLRHGDTVHIGAARGHHSPYQLVSLNDGSAHGFGGTLQVGRAPTGSNRLQLADKTVSADHATLRVTPHDVVLEDVGSSNGTFVNGQRVGGPQILASGDEIDFGSTSQYRFMVNRDLVTPRPLANAAVRGGRILLNRPPRTVVPPPSGAINVGAAPPARRSRRFPWATALLPVLGGLAMYFGLGRNPVFLLLILMSPAIAIWNYFETRSDESRQHANQVDEFTANLERVKQELVEGAAIQRRWLDSVLPPKDAIEARIETGTDLWDRTPTHQDFGWLRVGTGPIPPMRTLQIEERGDPELVESARELRDETFYQSNGPHHINLLSEPVVGFVGRGGQLDQAMVGLVLDLAARHSPAEVAIVPVTTNQALGWVTWLPHAQLGPERARPSIPATAEGCQAVVGRLDELIERRLNGQDLSIGPSGIPLPHVVVLVVAPVPLPAATLTTLMARGRQAGVSFVHVSATSAALPNECVAILDLEGEPVLRRPGVGTSERLETVDGIEVARADALSRRLAPYVDAGARSQAAAIPSMVSLCDVNGVALPLVVEEVVERWRSAPTQVAAPIGRTGEDVIELSFDSTREGPHVLVAGTTRAGKSEFLQALVTGLALRYPASELNLLFVDWKGAATFRPFLDLPQAVGLLSDLDEGLADRALRSLQAELTHRKEVLQAAGVQKIDDLPRGTLPRLIVLFDEFAELIDNNPDFADGVVSVAQVGGSLGLHMVLAMQTPSGALNKRVENCINGRVVFRLKDAAESSSALGSPKAASLPATQPGRGYLKDGSNRLIEFQSAYGGAVSSVDHRKVAAKTVGVHAAPTLQPEGRSDLETLVEAIDGAARAHPTAVRPPWVAPLPKRLSLDQLQQPASVADPGPRIGLIDDPDHQTRTGYALDLAAMRNVLIAGAGGSGRTSAIRTIVDGLARTSPATELSIYGIDFGGGLDGLNSIPHVGGVVTNDDPDRLRRLLVMLGSAIEERKSAPANEPGTARPAADSKIVVVIDGLLPLMTELAELDFGAWSGALQSILSDGPGLGVHVVAATIDPLLRQSVLNLFGERLVLHQTLRDGYSNLGVAGLPLTSHEPGRALSSFHRLEVQLALAAGPGRHDSNHQNEDIRSRWQGSERTAPPIETLPSLVEPVIERDPDHPLSLVVGIDDTSFEPLTVDLARKPLLIVSGPDLSGRTSTISWIRHQLASRAPLRAERFLISEATAPEPGWAAEWRGPDAILTRLRELPDEPFDGVTFLGLDDADAFLDMTPATTPEDREARKTVEEIGRLMNQLLDEARQRALIVVVGGRLADLGRAQGWLKRGREAKQALVLSPPSLGTTSADAVYGVRYPRRSSYVPKPGRGVLIRGADTALVQVPFVGADSA